MAYIAIASAVASTAAAQITASKQAKALTAQGQERSNEATEAGSAQLGLRARQARVDAGRAEVAGGESGVQGQSYEAGINNTKVQSNLDSGNIEQNTLNAQKGNTQDVAATSSRITQPNYLGAALQIGGAAYNGYTPTPSSTSVQTGTAQANYMMNGPS